MATSVHVTIFVTGDSIVDTWYTDGELVTKSVSRWRVGVFDCATLACSWQTLDNVHLTEDEALSVVQRWQAVDSGRRYNWLDGRLEAKEAKRGA